MFQNSDVGWKYRWLLIVFVRYYLRISQQRRYPVLIKVGHLAFPAHTSSKTALIWDLSSVCDRIWPSFSESCIIQAAVYEVFWPSFFTVFFRPSMSTLWQKLHIGYEQILPHLYIFTTHGHLPHIDQCFITYMFERVSLNDLMKKQDRQLRIL
jgi:hypothetical protein